MKMRAALPTLCLPLVIVPLLAAGLLFGMKAVNGERRIWIAQPALGLPAVGPVNSPTLRQQVRNAEIQRLIAHNCWLMHRHYFHGNAGAWAECARRRGR